MEDFKVSIDKFDGPLDLMLHLIRENKLDLMDLDVSELTAQYIAYLNSMETLHLEIASEYMVELATLIEYKSRKMLPADPGCPPASLAGPVRAPACTAALLTAAAAGFLLATEPPRAKTAWS